MKRAIEIVVADSVRVLGLGLKAEQIDHIGEADSEVGKRTGEETIGLSV